MQRKIVAVELGTSLLNRYHLVHQPPPPLPSAGNGGPPEADFFFQFRFISRKSRLDFNATGRRDDQ